MFLYETKRLIRKVLAEVILSRERVMAEIEALRQAMIAELAQLKGNLTAETEQLRIELEDALERADASDEAKEEAMVALDDYKSRISGLTDEVTAEGVFGEQSEELPDEGEAPLEVEETPPEPEILPLPEEEKTQYDTGVEDDEENPNDTDSFFYR